ncbi:MAG: T9SS type A sorting domain-containing protein [Flavobacteriales bacterium]
MRYAKFLFVVFMTVGWIHSLAINYYVSNSGSDVNNGLSIVSPFQTLQHAANLTVPGDTVFAMNGVYTNMSEASNVLNIYNSGNESQWIVYKNYPGHIPTIQLGSNNWSGIQIQGADYIVVEGFTIIGNNDSITLDYALSEQENLNNPSTSGNGIGCTAEYGNDSNKPHHFTVRRCNISKCGGAGIYTYGGDYLRIEKNTVSECAWYAPYGNSGISLYQCWNSDLSSGIRNLVIDNICFRNENYIPFFAVGSITDGNGIIVDDGRNTQSNSTLGVYLGTTYIANNLIYDNGGRGIHCYLSDNVIVVNNTCYKNNQSPAISDGELTAYSSSNVEFINNISWPANGIPPLDTFDAESLVILNNLWVENPEMADPYGTNSLTGLPDFVFASSIPDEANFRLQASSIAIDAGVLNNAPIFDLDGNIRYASDFSMDLGCYEYQIPLSLEDSSTIDERFLIYPNPSSTTIYFEQQLLDRESIEVAVFNSLGQNVSEMTSINGYNSIDISKLHVGSYHVQVLKEGVVIWKGSFIKREN